MPTTPVDEILEDCLVQIPLPLQQGVFANSFRVSPDDSQEDSLLIDFCLYDNDKQVAQVVSRVRVHKMFMVQLYEQLDRIYKEAQDNTPPPEEEGYIRYH